MGSRSDARTQTQGRAAPLPPAERREAILAAATPLLIARGAAVTTRELAAAAGVAEGTIFKVFADKDDLLRSAVRRAIDPAPFERAVRELDPDLDFEARLVAVTALMQRRLIDVWRLLQQVGPVGDDMFERPIPDNPSVIAVFDAARDRIRISPVDAARRLRAIMLALSNPDLIAPPVGPEEIVAMFLRGVEAVS